MYQPNPLTNSASSLPNGHISPPSAHNQANQIIPSESDSELSEAIDPPNTILSSLPHGDERDAEDTYTPDDSASSHDQDAIGSDDADYDMEGSPAVEAPVRDTSSPSQTSSRLGKRKASVEEEDFMGKNPELYGLRRSVRSPLSLDYLFTEGFNQGRPRPSRRVVSAAPFPTSSVACAKGTTGIQ